MKPFLTLILVCTFAANAQEPLARQPRSTVRSHGEAVVSAKPDRVRVEVGVVSQAPSAQAAADQNAKQLAEVISQLKKGLGPAAEIRTTNYSLHPNYKTNRDGGAPTIAGYTAMNTVQVVIDDVTAASRIIDTASRNGANNIQGVHFTIKDEQKVRMQALQDAARQARANAEALAGTLGLKVLRVFSVDDGQPVVVHPVRQMMEMADAGMMRSSVPTPVEPGSIQVRATVTVTLEVGQ